MELTRIDGVEEHYFIGNPMRHPATKTPINSYSLLSATGSVLEPTCHSLMDPLGFYLF